MVMDAQIVTVTRDEWSDYVEDDTVDVKCHFRQIDRMQRVVHGEESDADAMIWMPYDTDVENGSIVRFDSVDYQIDRIYQARRLGESQIHFIKCDLKVTQVA